MSQNLLDDNWDEVPRKPAEQPKPATWLGSACVWGPAQSQGSKTAFIHPHAKRPNGSPVVVITDANDKALKSWRQEVVDAMQRCKPPRPADTSVAVSVIVYVPRPRTHYRTNGELKPNAPQVPAAGRDIDKIARALLDAGQIAGWWVNDARVAELHVRRRYDDGIGERCWIWAWPLMRPDQQMPDLDETIDLGAERDLPSL